jgi:ketosteroid isomerase-like protein
MSNQPKSEAIDYNRLMQANLMRVFNERDAGRRIVAIRELYADDAVLYEPEASAKGHAAISDAVTALLAHCLRTSCSARQVRPSVTTISAA